MGKSSDIEDRRRALHAYEHAREVGRSTPHGVDFIDERLPDTRPRRRLPSLFQKRQPPETSQQSDHRVLEPATTAFKLGFGFAAGEWVFRLAVLAGSLILCLIFVLVALQALLD